VIGHKGVELGARDRPVGQARRDVRHQRLLGDDRQLGQGERAAVGQIAIQAGVEGRPCACDLDQRLQALARFLAPDFRLHPPAQPHLQRGIGEFAQLEKRRRVRRVRRHAFSFDPAIETSSQACGPGRRRC
jgi:hypothetical protein